MAKHRAAEEVASGQDTSLLNEDQGPEEEEEDRGRQSRDEGDVI